MPLSAGRAASIAGLASLNGGGYRGRGRSVPQAKKAGQRWALGACAAVMMIDVPIELLPVTMLARCVAHGELRI